MKYLIHIFAVIFYLFLSLNLTAQSKTISGNYKNFNRETIFSQSEINNISLPQFSQNEYTEALYKITKAATPPDSIIANLGNGKSEKHTFTYDTDSLLVEEIIHFMTDNTIDSVNKKTYEYDENRNETLVLTQQGWSFGWENIEKTKSEYDENGNIVMRLWQKWDHNNNIWVNSYRNSDAYNSEGKNYLSMQENWDGTKWVTSARYTNEYDANGNLMNDIIEFENNGILENWRKSGYTYDATGNQLTYSNFWWQDGAWYNSYKIIYEYDSQNRMMSRYYYYSPSVSDSLEVVTISTFQYEIVDLSVSEIEITFEYVDGNLVPSTRRRTDFNSNQDRIYIFSETYNMDNFGWDYQSRSNFNYNNDGILTSYVYEIWENSEWVNIQRLLSEYDLNGNNTYQSMQLWENGEWVPTRTSITIVISDKLSFWFLAEEVFLYYANPVSVVNKIDQLPLKFNIEQNYPNPFNPTTKIKYQVVRNKNISIKVYDTLGKEVVILVNEQKQPGVYEVEFNAAGLSSGIYFYSIHAADFFDTKKMILIK